MDPDNNPDFEKMSCGSGTASQWWLSWDWEYAGWNSANLEVETSIQFTTSSFSQSSFNDPYNSGYNYGFIFAKHFGIKEGTGNVATVEVGNEPWGYSGDPNFYSNILLGMAKGVKDADPTMRVIPAHFSSLSEDLLRINKTHFKYLDGLNIHAYSWIQTNLGRTAIYPEHNMSTLHSVNSMLRFRDGNFPNLPVYLTEWGWDSAGGGEDCGPPAGRVGDPTPTCVSEAAQALYAVRGALLLARKGLARLTWYFYGNTVLTPQNWDTSKNLFARSGLSSSSAAGYKKKLSLFAIESFIGSLGDTFFQSVVREDKDSLLGSGALTYSHCVAWRPVDAQLTGSVVVSFSLPSGLYPVAAFSIGGVGAVTSCALPEANAGGELSRLILAYINFLSSKKY
jgi:serine/threonine-protein kinase ATR